MPISTAQPTPDTSLLSAAAVQTSELRAAFAGFQHFLPVTDPVLIFALVMLILLIAPLVAARARMPGIIGLILAGAIVGPGALQLLARDQTIILLGTVGLLYLMFVAGLSLDLNQFARYRARSLSFGLISFFIPQLAAISFGTHLLGYSLATSVLLGSVVGTHTLLAYPIVARLGITRNKAVTVVTGGSVVCDSLGLILLAIVAASTRGELNPEFWTRFTVLLVGFGVVVVFGLPRFGQWFFRNVQDEPKTDFIFLLVVLFATAWVASLVNLAPLIGAFMAGLAMNRLVPESSVLMNRVRFVGEALFIPFFLLSVGMLVDFRVLVTSWEVWAVTGVFTYIVLAGKTLAAKIVQWGFKHTPAEGWVMAGLSIPQAAATLAVTLIGFDLGLFDQTAVNAVVMMILLTCMVGPWLVEKHGRRVAIAEEEAAPQRAGLEMPSRLLVPLANPATAGPLLDLAFMLRDPASTEPVYPLTVARDGSDVQEQVAQSEKTLSYAVIHAAAADVPVQPLTRIDMNIAGGIMRAVREMRIATVVIGWTGEASTRERIFGTVLDQLLDSSQQMVLVCKLDHPLNTTQRIVLVVPPLADRDPGFAPLIQAVKTLVEQTGAKLMIVATQSSLDRIRRRVEKGRAIKAVYHPIPAWTALMTQLDEQLTDTDLLVLVSARQRRLAWLPDLERLPLRFARQFPGTSFVTAYPAEADHDHAEAIPAYGSLNDLLVQQGIVTGLNHLKHDEVLTRIVEPRFGQNPRELKHLVKTLIRNLHEFATEVTAGVLLIHAHVHLVDRPSLFMGLSSDGLTFPKVGSKVHVVFVLLTPVHYPRERHLQSLAQVAHLVHEPHTVERLRAAASPAEAMLALEPAEQPANNPILAAETNLGPSLFDEDAAGI